MEQSCLCLCLEVRLGGREAVDAGWSPGQTVEGIRFSWMLSLLGGPLLLGTSTMLRTHIGQVAFSCKYRHL